MPHSTSTCKIPSTKSRLRNQFDTAYPSKSPSGMIRRPSNFQTQILHLAVIQICHLSSPIQKQSHLGPNSFWQPLKVMQCQVVLLSRAYCLQPTNVLARIHLYTTTMPPSYRWFLPFISRYVMISVGICTNCMKIADGMVVAGCTCTNGMQNGGRNGGPLTRYCLTTSARTYCLNADLLFMWLLLALALEWCENWDGWWASNSILPHHEGPNILFECWSVWMLICFFYFLLKCIY